VSLVYSAIQWHISEYKVHTPNYNPTLLIRHEGFRGIEMIYLDAC